ncbi:MAG: ABC transporter permease, partial [Deltaproteobacteria bacterium]|nr:ABC transporter permease [Deltaproteobacteria bacterium]
MTTFIIRRLILAFFVLILATMMVFSMMRFLPG